MVWNAGSCSASCLCLGARGLIAACSPTRDRGCWMSIGFKIGKTLVDSARAARNVVRPPARSQALGRSRPAIATRARVPAGGQSSTRPDFRTTYLRGPATGSARVPIGRSTAAARNVPRPRSATTPNQSPASAVPDRRSVGTPIDNSVERVAQSFIRSAGYRKYRALTPVGKLAAGTALTAGTGAVVAGGPNPVNWPAGVRDAAQWAHANRNTIALYSSALVGIALIPKVPSVAMRIRASAGIAKGASKSADVLKRMHADRVTSKLHTVAYNRRRQVEIVTEAPTANARPGSATAWRLRLADRPTGKLLKKLGYPGAAIGTVVAGANFVDSVQRTRANDSSSNIAVLGLNGLGAVTGATYLGSLQRGPKVLLETAGLTRTINNGAEKPLRGMSGPEGNLIREKLRQVAKEAEKAPAWKTRDRLKEIKKELPDTQPIPEPIERAQQAAEKLQRTADRARSWTGVTDFLWHGGVAGSLALNAANTTKSLNEGDAPSARDGYVVFDTAAKLYLSLAR